MKTAYLTKILKLNFKTKFLLLLFLCTAFMGYAQVTVTGALVGNGTYATLGAAFTAINGGTQTSATINIAITSSTNELTTSAALNAGTWTSLTILPSGGGDKSIRGGPPAGSALINLNGADNVTIDGLNTGGNSLTISNTFPSSVAGTSTIRFIADASNNTITNCTLSGSSTLATTGTILFSTGTTTGNDSNTISNCAITPAGSTFLPVNAIYSAGTSATIDNNNNTIHNNIIQDYFSPTISSAGILLGLNNASWTITNNKLFQTATRTVSANSLTIRGIGVITASAGGYTISNNTIGFANASGTGTTTYDGLVTSLYRGIELTANTTVSSIQGNTVAGINFTTGNTTTTGLGVFSGIAVNSGSVNIGTSTGNTIGSSNSLSSIVINDTATVSKRINGIYVSSASATAAIQNNNVGGFSTGTGATFGYNFIGIASAGASGNFTIRNNTIGSTKLANSIAMGDINTTSGVCTIQGINNAATGTIRIDSNAVINNTVFGTGASTISGIINTGGIGNAITINANLIANASVTGIGGTSVGLSNSVAASTLSINYNTIRGYNITNATGIFTAIVNSGVVTSSIFINSNKLGDATGDLITYTIANSGAFRGISNTTGAATATLSIQNNDIRGIVHSLTGSSGHIYIINSAATLTQNINGNTFTNLSVNTTGTVTFISNNVALPASGIQTINNNLIVTAYAKTGASGNVTVFTTAATSSTDATITNTGNNFSNITVSGTSILTGWSQIDTGLTTKTVSNNIFTNWTAVTGAITVMTVNGFANISTIANNTISTITGQGAITGLNLGAAGSATALNVNGNSITVLSSTGTGGAVAGLTSANNSTGVNVFNNSINNLSSTGNSAVNGVNVIGGTGTFSVYANIINDIRGTSPVNPSANGINISGVNTASVLIFKNKIYDIAENGVSIGATVNGLNITGGINVTCYNNIIGEIKAPNVSRNDAVRGIFINSSVANSNYRLYYNTVYLNATSVGANFGTYGLYHAANAVSTTANLTLNNNIIINNSVAKGTGKTVSFQRNIASLENYNGSSNHNLFYAGVPSSSNLLLQVTSTGYPTLTDFQRLVLNRESNSVTENTVFLSTSPSNINYLKFDTTAESFVESNGINIADFTSDYADVIRQGNAGATSTGTAPDLGAFEQEGLVVSYKPIVVSGASIGNGNYTTLGSAFMAINQGAQTGANISISINGNTNEASTGTAHLNEGTWNSITITPNGDRIISGAMLAGSPLINLNGADNVTIDGLNTGGNTLTLTNTIVSGSTGTSTITFINDASNNTITNCTISSSNTSNIIFFSTGIVTGNDGNTISNCAIKPAGVNLPSSAIFSAGTSAEIDNSGNIIHNNTIQDYSLQGVFLSSNSATWTMTYNKLFQTEKRTVGHGSLIRAMLINTPSAGGYTINFNTIGFANDSGTGYTIYDGATFNAYRAIAFTANNITSNIQGNIIAGINITKSKDESVSSSGIFAGIQVNAGAVNVGNITANTIGSSTVLSSIVINNSTARSIKIFGIYVITTSANSSIQNNIVGGFSTGTGDTSGYDFVGIASIGSSGNFTIKNNSIGSTSIANSITMGDANTTSGVCAIQGINNTATGNVSIDSNTVINTAVFGSTPTISGIVNAGGIAVTINANLIANASVTGTGGISYGLSNTAAATTLRMNHNTIRGYSISNTTGIFRPIYNLASITSLISIDSNKLGDLNAGLVNYTVANSGTFTGITNSISTAIPSVSIQSNDIRGITNTIAGTHFQDYISNGFGSAANLLNINNNTFTNLNVNTSGRVTFMIPQNNSPENSIENVNYNRIVTGFVNNGIGGDIVLHATFSTSASSATITNSYNNFSNITALGANEIRGWFSTNPGFPTRILSNNTFENWNGATGRMQVMRVSNIGNISTVSGNTINNISHPGSTSNATISVTGLNFSNIGNATEVNISNNSVIGLTSPNSITAFNIGNTSINFNIFNNTIRGIVTSGDSAAATGLAFGFATGTMNVFGNTVSNIQANGTLYPRARGVHIYGNSPTNFNNNKVYDIAINGSNTAGFVEGLLINDSASNCYNNLIGDLKAPNTSSTTAIKGISVNIGYDLRNFKFYNNSVYLNATSTGTDFGTAAISHTTDSLFSSNTSQLDIRNNIIYNTSTANGAGKTVALLGTGYYANFYNYNNTSNNNLLYAGTPGVNNLLYSDSLTNLQTLADLQTALTPRESNSKSGVVSFVSTAGASSHFLRPDSTNSITANLLSENATSLTTVTTDFDGRTRTSNPDIGAYQFDVNYIWTGGNGNWSNASNWNIGKVPVGTQGITISGGTASLDTTISLQRGKTLLLGGTGSMVVAPSKSLTINTGTTISIQNGANLSLAPSATINVNGAISNNGIFTLQSDATGTANIGTSNGTISGNVTVQRFVPGSRRAFRFFSHPFSSAVALSNMIGTTGLIITGSGGASNGFDESTLNNPSAFTFNEATFDGSNNSGWNAFANTSNTLAVGSGIRTLHRGARAQLPNILLANPPVPQAATIVWAGPITTGNKTFSMLKTTGTNGGWNLIGNPYASAVNIGALASGNRNSIGTCNVWNPNLAAAGAYQSISFGADYILPSGSAFFINTPNAANFTFTESDKSTANEAILFKNNDLMQNALEIKLLSDSTIHWDNFVLRNRSILTDAYEYTADGLKMKNSNVNVYTVSADKMNLAIDNRPLDEYKEVKMVFETSSNYHFTFQVANIQMSGLEVYLQDKFANKTVLLTTNTAYDFVTTSDASSQGNERFKLTFKKVITSVAELSPSKIAFSLYPNPASSTIHLSMANPVGMHAYVIYNQLGVQVQAGQLNYNIQRSHVIQIENLAGGIYFVQLDGEQVMRFIK